MASNIAKTNLRTAISARGRRWRIIAQQRVAVAAAALRIDKATAAGIDSGRSCSNELHSTRKIFRAKLPSFLLAQAPFDLDLDAFAIVFGLALKFELKAVDSSARSAPIANARTFPGGDQK